MEDLAEVGVDSVEGLRGGRSGLCGMRGRGGGRRILIENILEQWI